VHVCMYVCVYVLASLFDSYSSISLIDDEFVECSVLVIPRYSGIKDPLNIEPIMIHHYSALAFLCGSLSLCLSLYSVSVFVYHRVVIVCVSL